VFRKTGGNREEADLAVNLARTGAFFSNNQAPLSSRTVRFISGIHFPPGISFTPNAALYGIENTNRGCALSRSFNAGQEITPTRSLSGGRGLGIVTSWPPRRWTGSSVRRSPRPTRPAPASACRSGAARGWFNGVRLPYFKFSRNPTQQRLGRASATRGGVLARVTGKDLAGGDPPADGDLTTMPAGLASASG
jgi:hypothetical protein